MHHHPLKRAGAIRERQYPTDPRREQPQPVAGGVGRAGAGERDR
jgi:hypothetical protein